MTASKKVAPATPYHLPVPRVLEELRRLNLDILRTHEELGQHGAQEVRQLQLERDALEQRILATGAKHLHTLGGDAVAAVLVSMRHLEGLSAFVKGVLPYAIIRSFHDGGAESGTRDMQSLVDVLSHLKRVGTDELYDAVREIAHLPQLTRLLDSDSSAWTTDLKLVDDLVHAAQGAVPAPVDDEALLWLVTRLHVAQEMVWNASFHVKPRAQDEYMELLPEHEPDSETVPGKGSAVGANHIVSRALDDLAQFEQRHLHRDIGHVEQKAYRGLRQLEQHGYSHVADDEHDSSDTEADKIIERVQAELVVEARRNGNAAASTPSTPAASLGDGGDNSGSDHGGSSIWSQTRPSSLSSAHMYRNPIDRLLRMKGSSTTATTSFVDGPD